MGTNLLAVLQIEGLREWFGNWFTSVLFQIYFTHLLVSSLCRLYVELSFNTFIARLIRLMFEVELRYRAVTQSYNES